MENLTTNKQLYDIDRQYKDFTNFIKFIDENQNFYNGNQYPNANFKNAIRVTMNIVSFSANIKASKICGTPIYLTFTANKNDIDCTKLRQFDEYNCNKLNLKENNFQAALNGYVNGTEVTYIRWDEDDTTYKGIYKGGLVEEHIDLRNFAVANPYIHEIQNQKWVMFWEDFEVGAVKDLIEGNSKEEIEAKKECINRRFAKESDDYKNYENINHALCRVYTRFFRVDNEVYFMCSTDEVDLFAFPHPLSRKVSSEKIKQIVEEYIKKQDEIKDDELVKDYKIDYEDLIMNAYKKDTLSNKEYKEIKEKFSLYPFAVFRPLAQNRSFYGRSDSKQMIPIQKAINFSLSMQLKCIENNAYQKIFAKPEALKGQVITNDPSQIIIDYSGFTNGWGIKLAETPPTPNGLMETTNNLLSMTRVVYGFNDVMDGSLTNQDMSGYMLQQMIKQSNTSIEQQQQLFWCYNKDKAAIRLLYYKHYVDEAEYTVELTDTEYEGEEQARKTLYSATLEGNGLPTNPNAKPEDFEKETNRVRLETIKNEDIYGINFDISIDAMQGLSDSKLVEQQMFDNLLLNGGINNIQPEILDMYLQASPNVSQRTKTALNNVIENLKQSKCRRLEEQVAQLTAQLQQTSEYAKQLEGVKSYQENYLKNLQNEFTTKIDNSNKIISSLSADLSKATEGEVKSNNSRGIKGTHQMSSTPAEQVD